MAWGFVVIERPIESFRVSSELVEGSDSLRLDASHYNHSVIEAIAALGRSGMEVRTLGELVERVFIPPRFRRVYVEESHGVPFLQGSHIVHFEPADIKYLSKTAHVRLERWVIRRGWILVTCSGTVGRVALTPKEWDGWAASQHILRIVPKRNDACPPGYLATFLASRLGHVQLSAQIYGAVVDELTEDQAKSVRVPIATNQEQLRHVRAIDELAMQSVLLRTQAVDLAKQAMQSLRRILPEQEELATGEQPLAVDDPGSHNTGPEAVTRGLLRTPVSKSAHSGRGRP